ncbi:hypothetical protein [Mechercharimyces sp. CAU 1602]|uniref:hypothetical protein n=1 Tax=Mechercharimyces sp. CAU 1602 TaxID=2973933 RepID=UPI002163A679|nr:hypothetical protein [Mechercharimyces sp. CAU 1602]MCS1352543.1 hypothetical protein [Mechercharimyces sp. CAU 1602]
MTSWQGLLHKDYRIGRTGALIWIGLVTLLILYLNFKNGGQLAGFGFITFLSYFYIPTYFFISLQREGAQLHRWLHNPYPVRTLLLSKLLNACFALLITVCIQTLYFAITIWIHPEVAEPFTKWLSYRDVLNVDTLYIAGNIANFFLLGNLFFCGALLLLWSLTQWLKTYTGKGASYIISVVAILLFIGTMQLISMLSQLGTTIIFTPELLNEYSIYIDIAITLLGLLISFALFAFSTWILEKKVEV